MDDDGKITQPGGNPIGNAERRYLVRPRQWRASAGWVVADDWKVKIAVRNLASRCRYGAASPARQPVKLPSKTLLTLELEHKLLIETRGADSYSNVSRLTGWLNSRSKVGRG